MPGKPSHGSNPRRPTRRYFEKFSRDARYKTPSNYIERIGFMANPKEWLIPTSGKKPADVSDLVEEMRQKGWVQIRIAKDKRLKIVPTRQAMGMHFLTRYCLSVRPFVRLPENTKLDLVKVYLVTLIRAQDYNPASRKYNSGRPLSQRDILARIAMDSDLVRLNRAFRPFGDPKKWDPLTKQYYHFLAQKAAIALAADEYLTQKRWDALIDLRSRHSLQQMLPKFPWGRKGME